MDALQNLWHRLTAPQSTSDDDARREYMTKVIFVILMVVGVVMPAAFFVGWLAGNTPAVSLTVTVIMEIFLVAGWWLSDKGYWRFTSYVPPILFFLLALYLNIQTGLGTIAMLQYAIALLLTSILVGGIMQWIMLGLCIGAYLYIGWMHVQGALPPIPPAEVRYMAFAVPVTGMLISIAILQWFYTRQFQRTMAEARTYADELAEHRASLEQTVVERTAELNRLLNSISDAVISTTPEGEILSWNPAAERLFGWTAEEALGESVAMLSPSQDAFLALQDKAVTPAMTGTPQQAETSMRCKDNSERVARIGFSAIFDDQHNPAGIVAIVADITEQKHMEAEQERLQQEVITAQQQVIQELSTPVIPVMQGIIVMPLVGNIDSMRAQDITRSLLAGISRHRARTVIIDVTGVSLMDTGIVDRLNKTIQAAQLKGAHTIVTGISDAVAESIVDLGIDWSNITTLSNLQMGLHAALAGMGLHINAREVM